MSTTAAMTVVIRRRGGLMGLIALLAAGMAAGYLWRFSQTQSGLALALGVVLGVVAVVHGLAFGDARTPLLVADQTGLRVRLGGDWVGLTWTQIQRLEVEERGRVRDGHVAVLAPDLGDALQQATLRSRFGATFNRFAYDAPLVVPFGLTTTLSVVDVADALTRLSQGRAPVVVLNAPLEEPTPTVEVTAQTRATTDPVAESAANDESGDIASPDVTPDPPRPSPWTPAALGVGSFKLPWPMPRRTAPEHAGAEAQAARAASPLTSSPACRAEVTMPIRRDPATDGMLALSETHTSIDTEPLPEISELRRARDRDDGAARQGREDDQDRGNVGLIIDATTDLSARAMRKVRRPSAPASDVPSIAPVTEAVEDRLLIGRVLTEARDRLGLSVDELAERTRIRPFVIESIEVDDFRPCGGDFYARGHLRMLGRVLGIDAEPLVATYDDRFSDQPITPRAIFDAELSAGTTGMVRGGAPGSNWGGLIAAVLVLMLIWGVAQYFSGANGPTADEPVAPQNSAGLGSPGPGNKPLPEPKAPEPTMTFVKVMARGGASRIVVRDTTDDIVYAGRLVDGDSTRVVGAAPLRVMAVDAGVVALRIQDQQLGLMGEKGQRGFRRIPATR